MGTHNICFYGEIRKIIPELSALQKYSAVLDMTFLVSKYSSIVLI